MSKIAIAVHGGAGEDSEFLRNNIQGYEKGIREAAEAGYKILRRGGSALDATEEAVRLLEDDIHFNAGRGSALNSLGEVEMDASIMNGKTLRAGAVSMVKNVRNPISLARYIMNKTKHILLSGEGAIDFAKKHKLDLEPDSYFITTHQYDMYMGCRNELDVKKELEKKYHGTVGAVALDVHGNLAAATSTGGTCNSLPGRIGDSCIIGAGCYANNDICAISGTGEGELLISRVIAHSIAMAMEMKGMTMQQACDYILHDKYKDMNGDVGVICVDKEGNFGISFNSERMSRAWISSDEEMVVKIYH